MKLRKKKKLKNKFTIMNLKKEFLHREICSLCFIASFGMAIRRPFYKKNADRESIKEFLRNELFKLLDTYAQKVDGKAHIKIIKKLRNLINRKFGSQLVSGGMTFGRAQKLINLYLKYVWACGFVKQPPHCPIDSIVIQKLQKLGQEVGGIQLIKMKQQEYEKAIRAIEKISNGQSIAEWELKVFNQ